MAFFIHFINFHFFSPTFLQYYFQFKVITLLFNYRQNFLNLLIHSKFNFFRFNYLKIYFIQNLILLQIFTCYFILLICQLFLNLSCYYFHLLLSLEVTALLIVILIPNCLFNSSFVNNFTYIYFPLLSFTLFIFYNIKINS